MTPTDESTTESQVNWDGEKVSDGPWLEQSVLKINDTPASLIEAIGPDVLVKGGDYTVEQIAGHDSVLARGGEVIILDFVPGHSTTGLIERLGK